LKRKWEIPARLHDVGSLHGAEAVARNDK